MSDPISKEPRCVHCLRYVAKTTADHVFPSSWYPDTTPSTVQRWTVPVCTECNNKHGQLENDLLTRLMLCIDPSLEGVSGLKFKVLRSLGLDIDGLSKAEKERREARRAKIRAELTRDENLLNGPARVPGLPAHEDSQYGVPIPYAGLSIITEKIVRGAEYKLHGRYVEPPYKVLTFIHDSDSVPQPFRPFLYSYDLGHGCRIRRLKTIEDANVVRYWITVWGTLHIGAMIDHEDYILRIQRTMPRPEGVIPPSNRGMTIPPYLRQLPVPPE